METTAERINKYISAGILEDTPVACLTDPCNLANLVEVLGKIPGARVYVPNEDRYVKITQRSFTFFFLFDENDTFISDDVIILDDKSTFSLRPNYVQKLFSANADLAKCQLAFNSLADQKYNDVLFAKVYDIFKSCNTAEIESTLSSLLSSSWAFLDSYELAGIERLREEIADSLQNQVGIFVVLLQHSFRNLHRLPCFSNKQIFDQALSYDHGHVQLSTMEVACELGSSDAAFRLGAELSTRDDYSRRDLSSREIALQNQAAELFLTSSDSLPCIWNLAFLLYHYADILNERTIEETAEKFGISFMNTTRAHPPAGISQEGASLYTEIYGKSIFQDAARYDAFKPLKGFRVALDLFFILAFKKGINFPKAYNSICIMIGEKGQRKSIDFFPGLSDECRDQIIYKLRTAGRQQGDVICLANESRYLRWRIEQCHSYEEAFKDLDLFLWENGLLLKLGYPHALFDRAVVYRKLSEFGKANWETAVKLYEEQISEIESKPIKNSTDNDRLLRCKDALSKINSEIFGINPAEAGVVSDNSTVFSLSKKLKYCINCGEELPAYDFEMNYCPFCRAKLPHE